MRRKPLTHRPFLFSSLGRIVRLAGSSTPCRTMDMKVITLRMEELKERESNSITELQYQLCFTWGHVFHEKALP